MQTGTASLGEGALHFTALLRKVHVAGEGRSSGWLAPGMIVVCCRCAAEVICEL